MRHLSGSPSQKQPQIHPGCSAGEEEWIIIIIHYGLHFWWVMEEWSKTWQSDAKQWRKANQNMADWSNTEKQKIQFDTTDEAITIAQDWMWMTCTLSNTTLYLWDRQATMKPKASWIGGCYRQQKATHSIFSVAHCPATPFGQHSISVRSSGDNEEVRILIWSTKNHWIDKKWFLPLF